jgi:GNAT superfamily N-acetyltransferase
MQGISESELENGVKLSILNSDRNISLTVRSEHFSRGCINADRADFMGEGVWWLARLRIRPEYQEQGYGAMLLKQLQSELLEHADFKTLVVAPGGYNSNPKRLFAFYRRHGFKSRADEALEWSRP